MFFFPEKGAVGPKRLGTYGSDLWISVDKYTSVIDRCIVNLTVLESFVRLKNCNLQHSTVNEQL